MVSLDMLLTIMLLMWVHFSGTIIHCKIIKLTGLLLSTKSQQRLTHVSTIIFLSHYQH